MFFIDVLFHQKIFLLDPSLEVAPFHSHCTSSSQLSKHSVMIGCHKLIFNQHTRKNVLQAGYTTTFLVFLCWVNHQRGPTPFTFLWGNIELSITFIVVLKSTSCVYTFTCGECIYTFSSVVFPNQILFLWVVMDNTDYEGDLLLQTIGTCFEAIVPHARLLEGQLRINKKAKVSLSRWCLTHRLQNRVPKEK